MTPPPPRAGIHCKPAEGPTAMIPDVPQQKVGKVREVFREVRTESVKPF